MKDTRLFEQILEISLPWYVKKENLPEKHFHGFEALRGKNLKTGRAWAIKEQLRNFWDCSSVTEAREFFNDWYNWAIRSKLEPIKKTARIIFCNKRGFGGTQ